MARVFAKHLCHGPSVNRAHANSQTFPSQAAMSQGQSEPGSGDGAPSYKSCRARLCAATTLAACRVIEKNRDGFAPINPVHHGESQNSNEGQEFSLDFGEREEPIQWRPGRKVYAGS